LDSDEANGVELAKAVTSVHKSFWIKRKALCTVTDTNAVIPKAASKLHLK
jgi:hypothetical protein